MQKIYDINKATTPVLCLIDEIDARENETWPYEKFFSTLDLNLDEKRCIVFVLIGSYPTGMQGMIRSMECRSKGKDLLDRIPASNRFEIPAPVIEDRAIIIASHVLAAAEKRKLEVKEIEKLALYYALGNVDIQTPRQLSDLIQDAVNRLQQGEDRLKYDDLFFSGDRRNQKFWAEHQNVAMELSDIYILLKEK